ncbi:hypothetical protein HTY51_02140 [Rhodoferax sp. BAB1]|nr:hypothetical protein HTY51_02140 [Rhodoferax sp. BAB1]
MGLTVLTLSLTPSSWAGPGHDHGDTPAMTEGAASPRFTAVSESFELVGILQGKQLTLYLDQSADNSPVPDARLELELAGQKIPVQAQGVGEFVVSLAQELPPGQHAVMVTVVTARETDLLAGELDLHEDEHSHAQTGLLAWLLYAGLALLILALSVWGLRRRFGRRHPFLGGAA